MMHRNLDRRVEAMVRVTDRTAIARLAGILDMMAAPDVRSWVLTPDGWRQSPEDGDGRDVQEELLRKVTGGE
jgi:polyphosphate kinase